MRPSLTPIAPRPPVHGMGMSEDVFFSRQPGMTALQGQYFDFNTQNGAGMVDNPQLLPNPLLAPGYNHGTSLYIPNQTGAGINWQHEGGMSYDGTLHSMSAVNQLDPAVYADDEDDDMSISDDELPDPSDSRGMQTLSKTWNGSRVDARKFGLFAHSGALFSYMDSPANSELRNQGEITIFSYFLNVTSPTISMYERHPCDPVEKQEFHSKGHNLWSCKVSLPSNTKYLANCFPDTLPVIAFHHPGLLHAMLALASFQLAKIQNQIPIAAIRHYSRAIRRVAKNVNSPSRRTHLATLAATLLLGYFEVWMSDHKNWCKHLNGAGILLREIPLRAQARRCLPMRREMEKQQSLNDPTFLPKEQENLDYELLGKITGRAVVPEDYGLGEVEPATHLLEATEQDIEKFENLSDLFWWFCKMDVYQSILGGTKLL